MYLLHYNNYISLSSFLEIIHFLFFIETNAKTLIRQRFECYLITYFHKKNIF